ncbi:hypothetical protein AB4Y96_09175 [Phyllobacterium sp. TAF24]|uniref:hypothetical protein n=1 Tax=Phyllobacterium sp. TAF24 TaxID=3233068 RepID=UPI003F9A754E
MEATKQVWLRAFWGFSPEHEGYYGFTFDAVRKRFLSKAKDGDWVLIYGAVNEHTATDELRQALGFLELTNKPCMDVDRMSDTAVNRRRDGKFAHRWNFGLEVRKAWRFEHNVRIQHIAPEAYANKFRYERTSCGVLLNASETTRALSYPIVQVNVYGEPLINNTDLESGQAQSIFRPSKGIPPSFGLRLIDAEDGGNSIYLMRFSGAAEVLLGSRPAYSGKTIFKVGRSNDPKRRLSEINGGFPVPSLVKWELLNTHLYPDGQTAHDSETNLKASFDQSFLSLGGEFFLGGESDVQSSFLRHCSKSSIVMIGAPGKNKKLI